MSFPVQGGAPIVEGKFGVFILGFPVGYFLTAKIPSMKVKKTEVQSAGTAFVTKFPSGIFENVDDAEFEFYQGVNGQIDDAVDAWLRQGADARLQGASVPPEAAKRDVTVIQYDSDNTELHEWTLHGGFVVEGGPVELKNGSSDPSKRKLVVSIDWVESTRL